MELTQELLKSIINYNQETGIFTWKTRPVEMFFDSKNPKRNAASWNGKHAGESVGWVEKTTSSNCDYIKMKIFGKSMLAHRVAFLYMTGHFPSQCVDHIDWDGTNNSWANLRDVGRSDNGRNRGIQRNNKSGAHGGILVQH